MTENELMISVDDYAEFILQGMEAYLRMKEKVPIAMKKAG